MSLLFIHVSIYTLLLSLSAENRRQTIVGPRLVPTGTLRPGKHIVAPPSRALITRFNSLLQRRRGGGGKRVTATGGCRPYTGCVFSGRDINACPRVRDLTFPFGLTLGTCAVSETTSERRVPNGSRNELPSIPGRRTGERYFCPRNVLTLVLR